MYLLLFGFFAGVAVGFVWHDSIKESTANVRNQQKPLRQSNNSTKVLPKVTQVITADLTSKTPKPRQLAQLAGAIVGINLIWAIVPFVKPQSVKPFLWPIVKSLFDKYWPRDGIEDAPIEDSTERVQYMFRAFQMSQENALPVKRKTRVIVKDQNGGEYIIPLVPRPSELSIESRAHQETPLIGYRFYIALKQLESLGYKILYNPTTGTVMMRYQEERACIAFRSANRSVKVAAYWHSNPHSFNIWWEQWFFVKDWCGKPNIKGKLATLPAVTYDHDGKVGEGEEMYVPIRVLAGAIRTPPDKVIFKKGADPRAIAENSDIIIYIQENVKNLTAHSGSYNDKWAGSSEISSYLDTGNP